MVAESKEKGRSDADGSASGQEPTPIVNAKDTKPENQGQDIFKGSAAACSSAASKSESFKKH